METTLLTFMWAILLLMHYPEVQTKVQQEIDQIIGRDRLPDMNDRANMPYTVAAIHECQRFANVLTANIPHSVTEDVEVLGYKIPKDTVVLPLIAVLHFDDEVFENAQQFKPERFLSKDGKTFRNLEKLLPFSLGRRVCLGESLARMELFLIFVALLQQFTFQFTDDNPKPELRGKAGLTIGPFPYTVRIIKR